MSQAVTINSATDEQLDQADAILEGVVYFRGERGLNFRDSVIKYLQDNWASVWCDHHAPSPTSEEQWHTLFDQVWSRITRRGYSAEDDCKDPEGEAAYCHDF